MSHLNVEIKARCSDPDRVRRVLTEHGAAFHGTDRQVDTYFHCAQGRLKLREGNIEYALIHYDRPDHPGPKEAHVTLYHPPRDSALKQVLLRAFGVKVVVEKTREIYFADNVKFHIDDVDGLGGFIEIEAIDADGALGPDALHAQCRHYMDLFGIDPADLVDASYSDLLLPGRV
ncbi:MAG TPA: class IV adenylate cyclase [Phycisphaerae bacterium]|nr:class IV adenylate cyclase [Phycisphaerae bacterium]